jgi:hypothetical protein
MIGRLSISRAATLAGLLLVFQRLTLSDGKKVFCGIVR